MFICAPFGFRAVSFESISKLLRSLSITKMLKFNFATKQFFPMTRRAKRTLGIAIESKQLSIQSYNVLLFSFSMLQMLICNVTTKQMFTVTRRTSIYHRSAFPIAIRRADMNSSILDFQVVEFRFYDTACFALFHLVLIDQVLFSFFLCKFKFRSHSVFVFVFILFPD